MIDIIKAKIKMNKWFFFIPVIGPIIYFIRVEFFINNEYLENKDKDIKLVKKYKGIVNLIFLVIAIPFLVSFFVLRNKNGFGAFPWFFWVSLSIGLSFNVSPFIGYHLYKFGLKKYIEKKSS